MKFLVRGQPTNRGSIPRTGAKIQSMRELFHKIAHRASNFVGSPWAFIMALLIILVWVITGPIFDYSTTWQLFINTFTTIMTFLMVFLIQNTQNRDAKAVHLKLDELIRAIKTARNKLIELEDYSDTELDVLEKDFEKIRDIDETKKADRDGQRQKN